MHRTINTYKCFVMTENIKTTNVTTYHDNLKFEEINMPCTVTPQPFKPEACLHVM
jgi:hypothetical protein